MYPTMNDDIQYSTSTSLRYHSDIIIEYGKLKPLIEWATSNFEEDWNFSMLDQTGSAFTVGQFKYRFNFSSEKDYCKFLLWQK